MTALADYAKLESLARYHAAPGAVEHEVVLSFGERTLLITDLEDHPLAHWPLASLRAVSPPDAEETVLVPDLASDERVVLSDTAMIEAIGQVCPDLRLRPEVPKAPLPIGRWVMIVLALSLAIAGGWLTLNRERLVAHVSPDRAVALGEQVLMATVPGLEGGRTGVCAETEGRVALGQLLARLAGPGGAAPPRRLEILDRGDPLALVMPGGLVVLSRGVLEAAEGPEDVAAVLAHLLAHAEANGPLRAAVASAGLLDGLGLVLGGRIDEDLVEAGMWAVTAGAPEAEADAAARAREMLSRAGLPVVPTRAFAGRLDGAGIDAHRMRAIAGGVPGVLQAGQGAFVPALDDRDWILLQNICDRQAAF